eukprot:5825665-Prymnesium_polylepis.2
MDRRRDRAAVSQHRRPASSTRAALSLRAASDPERSGEWMMYGAKPPADAQPTPPRLGMNPGGGRGGAAADGVATTPSSAATTHRSTT